MRSDVAHAWGLALHDLPMDVDEALGLRRVSRWFATLVRDRVAVELDFSIRGHRRLFGRWVRGLRTPLRNVVSVKRFSSREAMRLDPVRIASWPPSLLRMGFSEHFFRCKHVLQFPPGLRALSLGASFNRCLDFTKDFPHLSALRLGGDFDHDVAAHLLPRTLRELRFGYRFNSPMDPGGLPDGLTKLRFGFCYNQTFRARGLPRGLEELVFGHRFDQPLDARGLPRGLLVLEFGHGFDQELDARGLPPTLTYLGLSECYAHRIDARGAGFAIAVSECRRNGSTSIFLHLINASVVTLFSAALAHRPSDWVIPILLLVAAAQIALTAFLSRCHWAS